MFQLMVVDDDKNIRRFLRSVLTDAGYRTFSAESGEEALNIMERHRIDLILLEVTLPGMNGFEFISLLRSCRNNVPILILSSQTLSQDIKNGFLSGADDYITKPVEEEILLLHIKALLRRARIMSDRHLIIGKTELNYETLTVHQNGKSQILPQKEFFLLYKLLSYPDQIFTRLQLMEEIWGPSSNSTSATVSVHINRLRKRFENCADFSIITIRGLGYKAQITPQIRQQE